MSKIIIHNRSSATDTQALRMVSLVVEMGRISKGDTQYCYHTTFGGGYGVSADRNKRSDRFTVVDEKQERTP